MAGNTARLKRMHSEAKKILKRHPNMKYGTALKEAGRKERKKKPARKKAAPKKSARKRAPKKVGTHYRVYHEVKKVGKRKTGGSIGGLTKGQVKKALEEKKAWTLLALDGAKTAKEKKALRAKKANINKGLTALASL